MSRSLSSRIGLMAALPALLTVLGLGSYLLATRIADTQQHSLDLQRLVTESYGARFQAHQHEPSAVQQTLLDSLLEEPDVRAATLHLPNVGLTLHAGPRMLPITETENASRQKTGAGWRWLTEVPHSAAVLEVEFSNYRQHIELLHTLLILLLAATAIITVTSFITARFGRAFTAPLEHIQHTLERLRDGHLDARATVKAPDELTRLQEALNQMASKLQEAQQELQHNMEQATEDLRESLETLEIQNIELDMARKEAQQASRIKSEFLANMSHEIRTPMNSIIGFTRTLLRSETEPQRLDALTTIRTSSEALLSIINDILDFSKIEAGKLSLDETPVCVQDVIEEVQTMLSPLAQEKNLEQATIIYSDFPHQVLGDPLRLRQVVTNLVSNAIKFTDQGSVVVRGMLESQKGQEVILKVTVTDTGSGLTETQRQDIFNAFSQADQSASRQEGGTGLGLAICRRLVESMGGEIGVDSQRGQGSSFWFTFRAPLHHDLGPEQKTLGQQRILLVESEEHSGLSLFHMLAGWQAEITQWQQFGSGQLETSTAFQAAVIGLPSTLSASQEQQLGQLLDTLQQQRVPLVLFAHHSEQLRHQLRDFGGQYRLLGKPATRKRLWQALQELLQDPAQPLAPNPRQHFQGTAMVVDDHPGNLKLAGFLLAEHGLKTLLCHSGPEALETIRRQTADIIFMDIQMPGMDGIQTTEQLNRLFADGTAQRAPVIALTAHALASEKSKLLAAGLDDYLTKPLDEDQLEYVLKRWLQKVDIAPPLPTSTPTPSAVDDDTSLLNYPLALKRCANRPELVLEMHQQLLAALPQDYDLLNSLYIQGDTSGLLETVHRLHGATRYCGLQLLELAAGRLETQLKQAPEAVEMDRALDELLRIIQQVLAQDVLSMITKASA